MSSKESNHKLVHKSEPYYTNEDIAILHDIVLHAEELLATLPDRERIPTNALFHAYYAILPSIGVDADHDNCYARVIFKIGGRRGEGTLYEKFEDVLSHMGIEIQFDHAEVEENQEESGKHFRDSNLDSSPQYNLVSNGPVGRLPRRRNSETSILPTGSRKYGDSRQRPRSNSLQPQSNLEHPSEFSHGNYSAASLSLASDQFSLQTHSDSEHSAKGIATWFNTKPNDYPIVSVESIQRIMQTKLALFATQSNQSSLSRILRHWRQRTAQLLEDNRNLEILAKNKDSAILLRQALDTWRTNLHGLWKAAETQRFFLDLELRAKRARDLFLLAKAFTHWTASASEEAQRTSVAWRHILRARFFRSWREVTAVNELKVRRHVLRKFFSSWRKRQGNAVARTEQSITISDKNHAKRIFWTWFWAFCERRAPIWWADRSKRRQLAAWVIKSRNSEATCAAAVDHRQHHSKYLIFQNWTKRVQKSTNMKERSMSLYQQVLCAKVLSCWRRHRLLLPRSRHLHDKHDAGLRTKMFGIWALRSRQERQARSIDQQKVKREAWISWNDKVRCRALQLRIGDRNLFQNLYKWVVAERLKLARRLADQNLLQVFLIHITDTSKVSIQQSTSNLETARQFHEHNTKYSILKKWELHSEHAMLNHRPSLVSSTSMKANAFSKWTTLLRSVQQLDTWATDASFYFIGTKSLKQWRIATETSKREKRRAAYAYIRRQNKLSLASSALSTWRQKSKSVADTESIASEMRNNWAIARSMNAFDRWRAHTQQIVELDSLYGPGPKRLVSAYYQWKARTNALDHLEGVALKFNEDRLLLVSLKKWTRLALQFRVHEHIVSELRDKHWKRSIRKMVLHWEQSLSNLKGRRINLEAERISAEDVKSIGRGSAQRAEGWPEPGDDADAVELAQGNDNVLAKSTIPGYLSTPSKRSSVSRTMANLSSTTPVAPLSTPYENQLRAQLSGRSLFLNSRTRMSSRGRAFEDIVERSPRSSDTG